MTAEKKARLSLFQGKGEKMHYFLLIICGLCFCATNVTATEQQITNSAEKKIESISEEQMQNMAEARKNLQSVQSDISFFSEQPAVLRPNCNNPRLLEKVLARISAYYEKHPQFSIMDQRQQVLLLKSLKKFQEISLKNFQPKDNYALADRIIDIKINDGIKEKDLSLCKSLGDREIYLLIYPQKSFYTIEIINFPGQINSKEFTTIYD